MAPGRDSPGDLFGYDARDSEVFPVSRLMEIGCGLGYVAARIRDEISGEKNLYGIDISPDAVRKTSGLHSGIDFISGDILQVETIKKILASVSNRMDMLLCKEVI